MDNLSQTSLSSDHSSTNSIGGMVEVINIEPGMDTDIDKEYLLQLVTISWLLAHLNVGNKAESQLIGRYYCDMYVFLSPLFILKQNQLK